MLWPADGSASRVPQRCTRQKHLGESRSHISLRQGQVFKIVRKIPQRDYASLERTGVGNPLLACVLDERRDILYIFNGIVTLH